MCVAAAVTVDIPTDIFADITTDITVELKAQVEIQQPKGLEVLLIAIYCWDSLKS